MEQHEKKNPIGFPLQSMGYHLELCANTLSPHGTHVIMKVDAIPTYPAMKDLESVWDLHEAHMAAP